MDIITQVNREDEEEDAQLNAYADKGKKRPSASASNLRSKSQISYWKKIGVNFFLYSSLGCILDTQFLRRHCNFE